MKYLLYLVRFEGDIPREVQTVSEKRKAPELARLEKIAAGLRLQYPGVRIVCDGAAA